MTGDPGLARQDRGSVRASRYVDRPDMRWYVEISPAGKEGEPTHKLCLEAPHWQPALQQARRILGHDDKLSGVAVEFMDDGCRATDAELSLLYVVTQAPDDAPVVEEAGDADDDGDSPAGGRRSKRRLSRAGKRGRSRRRREADETSEETPLSKEDAEEAAARKPAGKTQVIGSNVRSGARRSRPGISTVAYGSMGEAVEAEDEREAAAKAEEETAAEAEDEAAAKAEDEAAAKKAEDEAAAKKAEEEAAAKKKAEEEAAAKKKAEEEAAARKKARADRQKSLGALLVAERTREATDDEPLTCREESWYVELPLALGELVAFLDDRAEALGDEDADGATTTLLHVGIYDHRFDDEPQRAPIATSRWRGWREEAETVFFPYSTQPVTSAAEAEEVLGGSQVAAKAIPPDAAEEKKRAEEEAARKKAEEEAARKKAAEEAAAKKKAEAEAAKKKAEAEAAAKKAEAEAAKKAEAEAAAKKTDADEADAEKAAKKKSAPEDEAAPAKGGEPEPPTRKMDDSSKSGRKKVQKTMIGGTAAPEIAAAAAKAAKEAETTKGGEAKSSTSRRSLGDRKKKKKKRKKKQSLGTTTMRSEAPAESKGEPSSKVLVEEARESNQGVRASSPSRVKLGQGGQRPSAPAPMEFDQDLPSRAERDQRMASARERVSSLTPPQSLPGNRIAGEDLITDLFEDVAELHYLNDALEGAEFVLNLALEKLPCEAGLVSLYDIDKREYVVVRQAGGDKSAVLLRVPEKAPVPRKAMRSTQAVVLPKVKDGDLGSDRRWNEMGVEPRSLICAPVEKAGRYLGLLELANPHDGKAFNAGDGNAMSYIGQAFGEFLAERGVMLDPDAVVAQAEAAAR